MTSQPEFFTINELALHLGRSKRTLLRWHARRIGPARVRVGNLLVYRREAVENWLKRNESAVVR